MTTTNEQTVLSTALATAAAVAPSLASADPKVAAVVALAPVALQMLQSATMLQQAGVLPPAELANLFATVGQGIQSTHLQWAAMDAADAAGAPA